MRKKLFSSFEHSTSFILSAVTLGGSLEWYQIGLLYSWPLIIEHDVSNFSESIAESFNVATVLGLAIAFGATRILGGWFFGKKGDQQGRIEAFSKTLFFSTFPAIVLTVFAFTFPYKTWLAYSTWIFTFLRIAQGMPAGGEIPGAICYLSEAGNEPLKQPYLCSFAMLGPLIGLTLSTLICLVLAAVFSQSALLHIGWRFAFPIAALIGIIVYHMRKRLDESVEFSRLKAHHQITTSPLRAVIKEEKLSTFFGFLISVFEVVTFSVLSVLPLFYSQSLFNLNKHAVILLQLTTASFCGILLPIIGKLSCKHAHFPWLRVGAWSSIFLSIPLYFSLTRGHLTLSLFVYALMLIAFSIHAALLPAVLAKTFSVKIRYTGIAFSFNICDGVFWSLTTSLCSILIAQNNPLFISFIPISAGIFLATIWIYKDKKPKRVLI